MKTNNDHPEPGNSIIAPLNHSSTESLPVARSPRKKQYEPPKVIEYGNVARLTAGMNGTDFDPGHGTRSKNGGLL
jgi:hypothetical protein